MSYNKEVVLKEIEKCELVCANCHAVRTKNRLEPMEVADPVALSNAIAWQLKQTKVA